MSFPPEFGQDLWLRFDKVPPNWKEPCKEFTTVHFDESDAIIQTAISELTSAWEDLTGFTLLQNQSSDKKIIIGSIKSKLLSGFVPESQIQHLIDDGFIIRSFPDSNKNTIVIASKNEAGILYGVFCFLKLIQTGNSLDVIDVTENPSYQIRILNHWDNLDGTVERGYAGKSLWNWADLPSKISPRYKQYAKANASIGINATVLNNVNAPPEILSTEILDKVAILASIFRPYSLKVFLSVNFSSPSVLGGLETSDPLDPKVVEWWKNKVDEIYQLIPDFGGFLVKANSEGLPGPQDFGRTHADGANCLADALLPHNGIIMWRAFVYSPSSDDRAKQAYDEFMPLDGKFKDNVIIQIKNGPIDFQPREPFSPLFGHLENTQEMLEFQITQEYLGQGNHLVFLASLYSETLNSDTYSQGKNSTIGRITDGTITRQKITAIAGVANIGDNANWCGHHFAQGNWYSFGRLAWNNTLSPETIADEWIKMTLSSDPQFINPVKSMMLTSRETCVSYMMPLGLHHLFAWSHHYGPEPWCDIPNARPDWLPKYYHKADDIGIGFPRSSKGSNYVSQYFTPLKEKYDSIDTCPEELLLWFFHLPWHYIMKNHRTLWENLCYKYDSGVQQVREYQKTWDKLDGFIDSLRFKDVQFKLKIQCNDAVWWKDACLLYFQTFSKRPIPYDIERPIHDLSELMGDTNKNTFHSN